MESGGGNEDAGGGDREDYDSSHQQTNPSFHPPSTQHPNFHHHQMPNLGTFSATASASHQPPIGDAAQKPIRNHPPPPPPPEVASTTSTANNPKKRTRVRASKKAPPVPAAVQIPSIFVRTDTTNFKRVVQQYTGMPPPPPFSSNPAPRPRSLPLFSSSSSAASFRGPQQFGSFYPLWHSPQGLPNNPNYPLASAFIMNNNAAIPNNALAQLAHDESMQNQLLNAQPLRTHHQEGPRMGYPLSLDELASLSNQERASQVESQATSRVDDQERRNLNNEGQDGQHQHERK